MIIWLNGAFGSGKTTLSKALLEHIPNSIIYDPEEVGFIIHRAVPDSRKTDFQEFDMWRRLVVQFAIEFDSQFDRHLIVPMTLVVPEFRKEIFEALSKIRGGFHHFFLDIEEDLLRKRIANQKEMSDETNRWRLAQVDRCLNARSGMSEGTVFLNSGKCTPEELVNLIKEAIN